MPLLRHNQLENNIQELPRLENAERSHIPPNCFIRSKSHLRSRSSLKSFSRQRTNLHLSTLWAQNRNGWSFYWKEVRQSTRFWKAPLTWHLSTGLKSWRISMIEIVTSARVSTATITTRSPRAKCKLLKLLLNHVNTFVVVLHDLSGFLVGTNDEWHTMVVFLRLYLRKVSEAEFNARLNTYCWLISLHSPILPWRVPLLRFGVSVTIGFRRHWLPQVLPRRRRTWAIERVPFFWRGDKQGTHVRIQSIGS